MHAFMKGMLENFIKEQQENKNIIIVDKPLPNLLKEKANINNFHANSDIDIQLTLFALIFRVNICLESRVSKLLHITENSKILQFMPQCKSHSNIIEMTILIYIMKK